jgi:3-deoxy-D-manno-octulosonic-acid transferase
MILFFYRRVMLIIRWLLPFVKLIPHKKIQYFATHQGQVKIKIQFKEKPIWIHASSGEIEYALPLIRAIRKSFPHIPVLVTHTSSSSLKTLERLDVHAIGVLPVDETDSVRSFLNFVQPRICLLARTDLWPEMILELKNRHIPCSLFSATFAKGSKKTSRLSTQFLKSAIHNLSSIYFVDLEDQKLCETLFGSLRSGIVLGDTRYDQVTYRLHHATPLSIAKFEKTLLLGSTWDEDDQIWLSIAPRLKAEGWKLIWVPHEVNPQHLKKLVNRIHSHSLTVGYLSEKLNEWNWQNFDILLVDQVGQLAALYPFCDVAFVGGSFKKQVHSVMEPLAAGCPVLVGPYHYNNREALEFKNLGYVFEFANPDQGYQLCLQVFSRVKPLKIEILKQVQLRTGTTDKLLGKLQSIGVFDAHPLEPIKQSN